MGQRWHLTSRRIYTFYGKGNENHELGTCFFEHKRSISAIKMVEFVSDRIGSRWCDIILKVHVPTEDKIDDMRIGSTKNKNMYSINSLNTT
jgi:hypothetical protein